MGRQHHPYSYGKGQNKSGTFKIIFKIMADEQQELIWTRDIARELGIYPREKKGWSQHLARG